MPKYLCLTNIVPDFSLKKCFREKRSVMMQHLLLLVFFSFQLIRGDTIDMARDKDKRYLQKHPQSSINASTCEGTMDLRDEENYADYCDPLLDEGCNLPDDEAVCHFSRLNDTLRSDLVGEEVVKLFANNSRTCCSFHGFIETGDCDGRDKTGKEVDFSNVDVCVEHIHQGEIEVKPALDCPLHCQLVHGPLELFKNHIKGGVLTYENKTYENFCLGLKCEDNKRFQPWFEACGECVTDEVNRNLSTRTGLPNCCGLNDTMRLDGRSLECSSEKRNPALEKEFEVCSYRTKQSLKLTTDPANLSESICVQV